MSRDKRSRSRSSSRHHHRRRRDDDHHERDNDKHKNETTHRRRHHDHVDDDRGERRHHNNHRQHDDKRHEKTASTTAAPPPESVAADFDERGDMLELQQLQFRARVRIQERRAMPGDTLLHNFLLLTGNESYAVELSNTPCPPLRSVSDVVEDFLENGDALEELVTEITTLLRVHSAGKQYWRYVALLIECMMQQDVDGGATAVINTDNGGINNSSGESRWLSASIHPNIRSQLQGLVEGVMTQKELEHLYLVATAAINNTHNAGAALVGDEYLQDVRWNLAYVLCTRWLDAFHDEHVATYDKMCEKFSLGSSLLLEAAPSTAGSTPAAVDPRLLKGDPETEALRTAMSYLSRLGVHRINDTEKLVTGTRVGGGVPPPYVCRGQTGYEWNRYNSTHYDSTNLPPRVIKGYKLDVFYVDADAATALAGGGAFKPKFSVRPTAKGWDDDEAILLVSAGPPFADLSFTILNKPWNRSPRRGFKCQLDRGVFSLYFQYSFVRYRR
eukprot:PhM_4_TR1209/c0_g1_i1/m.20700